MFNRVFGFLLFETNFNFMLFETNFVSVICSYAIWYVIILLFFIFGFGILRSCQYTKLGPCHFPPKNNGGSKTKGSNTIMSTSFAMKF